MGFWHNWPAESGQGYKQGRFIPMNSIDIPEQYNIVAVAFINGSGMPTFRPCNMSDDHFRCQVNILNGQGRAVLLSMWGADGHISLTEGKERLLAYEIIRLCEAYGFNGLYIALEQSAITEADNRTVIPKSLRQV